MAASPVTTFHKFSLLNLQKEVRQFPWRVWGRGRGDVRGQAPSSGDKNVFSDVLAPMYLQKVKDKHLAKWRLALMPIA